MLLGGCYCGSTRYEITGKPIYLSNCHCSICRRTTGAPYVAWFSVPVGDFRFVRGKPSQFDSTAKAHRTFCAQCGTQLTFQHDDDPGYVDITTCSLDNPTLCAPEKHIYVADKLEWVELADHLPVFFESSPAE